MGMYDNIISSYPLGDRYTGVQCQTKDIDPEWYGTMSQYWISPNGELFIISFTDVFEFVRSENRPFGFDRVPTGKHGRVRPVELTSYIHIYPEKESLAEVNWRKLRLHFIDGKLMEFEEND